MLRQRQNSSDATGSELDRVTRGCHGIAANPASEPWASSSASPLHTWGLVFAYDRWSGRRHEYRQTRVPPVRVANRMLERGRFEGV